jgi:DNA-binding transcriptional regulator GbsR (MarR family)
MATLPKSLAAESSITSGLVLSGDRAADAVAFDEQVVDFFVTAADLLGVPKSVAAIYGIIFASPEPLSFADIETRLNLSKGSISQGLRVLREVGAVKESKGERLEARGEGTGDEAGARRFEPDLELRKLVARFIENRLEKQLDAGKTRLKNLGKAVPKLRADHTERLKGRLDHIQGWHDKARALLPVARTFLKIGGKG